MLLVCSSFADRLHTSALWGGPHAKAAISCRCSLGRHGQAWAGMGRHRQARAALEDEPGCCGGGDDGTISFWHCRLHTYIELAEK
jgi:hypothetical protein